MAKKKTTGKGASKAVTKAVPPVKKSASKAKAKKADKVKTSPPANTPAVNVHTSHLLNSSGGVINRNMSEVIAIISKNWNEKGASWIKKFELPQERMSAVLVLSQKIRYGKIQAKDLD